MSLTINDSCANILDQVTTVASELGNILDCLQIGERVLVQDITDQLIRFHGITLKKECVGMLISDMVNASDRFETVKGPHGGIKLNPDKVARVRKTPKAKAVKVAPAAEPESPATESQEPVAVVSADPSTFTHFPTISEALADVAQSAAVSE